MGTKIKEIILSKEIEIKELSGKVIAFDSMNLLYQFITTIMQRDGQLLKDSKGNVTSHLNGLFYRTTSLMNAGIKPVFVFDGIRPKLKEQEVERRTALKMQAQELYKEAIKKEDINLMKKYASRIAKLTPEMLEESKELLQALGIPIINAPSEGEAQASYLVKKKDAFAVASNDYDCLLFGVEKLIRNLSISQKRKKAHSFVTIKPEMISLTDNLNNLKLNQDQLIALSILVGTDFNYGGIKGIGPKNALKLVTKFGNDFDNLFKEAKWEDNFSYSWQEVFDTIKNMKVTDDYKLTWNTVDSEKIRKLLIDKHEFSSERVELSLEKLSVKSNSQKGLSDFF